MYWHNYISNIDIKWVSKYQVHCSDDKVVHLEYWEENSRSELTDLLNAIFNMHSVW